MSSMVGFQYYLARPLFFSASTDHFTSLKGHGHKAHIDYMYVITKKKTSHIRVKTFDCKNECKSFCPIFYDPLSFHFILY